MPKKLQQYQISLCLLVSKHSVLQIGAFFYYGYGISQEKKTGQLEYIYHVSLEGLFAKEKETIKHRPCV